MDCVEGILERYDNNVYAYMTKNMCLAVHIIGYLRNQFLFYRIFQSLWSVWRAFWRDMIIMYMHIWTRNMCSAVHSIGYVKNQFLFYRMFQSLWSVWRAFWRDMIIIYMQILTKNRCSPVQWSICTFKYILDFSLLSTIIGTDSNAFIQFL